MVPFVLGFALIGAAVVRHQARFGYFFSWEASKYPRDDVDFLLKLYGFSIWISSFCGFAVSSAVGKL